MSTDSSWIELAVAAVSLLILALAALAEASLAAANRISLREMIEGRSSPNRVQSLIDHPQLIRSSLVLLELLAALVIAAMLTRVFTRGVPSYGLPLAIVVSAVAVLLTARVLPAVLAPAEQWDEPRRMMRVASLMATAILPLTTLADLAARGLRRILAAGADHSAGAGEADGELPNGGNGELDIEEAEQEMISGVLGLEEATVREIMVPRLDIVAVPQDMPIAEVVDLIRKVGHSRIPVYRDSIDSIVGVIYAKDLLRFVQQDPTGATLLDLLRPAYFVPESKRVDELLRDMRQAKVHIAIVVDEYGGTAGLVTIEDILEEIVGEIQDEYDRETPLIERLGATEVIVDGRISVDEIADIFDTQFAEGETGTIGGFVQKRLGRIPQAGESLRADGLLIEVQAVEHHRIRKLRVVRVDEEPAPSGQEVGIS
ncbi:MAG: hemolysin family protein [Sphaerobacter sp.]|nr:hemolysin family protein [Sphaerobacter sp.]